MKFNTYFVGAKGRDKYETWKNTTTIINNNGGGTSYVPPENPGIQKITNEMVTEALGYVPYDSANPSKYISGINSGDVTKALGYTPYDAENPEGYINAIYKSDVTNALGYTPANKNELLDYVSKSELDLDLIKDAIGYTPAEAVSESDKSAKNSEKWGGYNIVVSDQAPGTARMTIYFTI